MSRMIFSAPVVEGSCNSTMEGEYCPEHGLAECGGMYEMGTVAGGIAPVMGHQQEAYYESKADNALGYWVRFPDRGTFHNGAAVAQMTVNHLVPGSNPGCGVDRVGNFRLYHIFTAL